MQPFEPTYYQFENRPVEAIKHLMKVQKGQAVKALYRNDIGFIDIVWGDEKVGLCKIVNKHGREFKKAGVLIEEIIPTILKNGSINKSRSDNNSIAIEHKFFRIAIYLTYNQKNKRFLMTAYDLLFPNRKPTVSGFTERSVSHQSNNSRKDNVLI